MRYDNVQMLEDTLRIFNKGKYTKNGKTVHTKLSKKQMEECYVYLPEDIQDIMNRKDFDHVHVMGRVGVSCQNIDSFSMAQEQHQHSFLCSGKKAKNPLVLNFANPVNPGGGVRRGAKAQEEDLCRKSSLLFSLESNHAQRYYKYNKSLNTYMGSDAIILTPNVEIIKDVNGELLDESVIVSVMTCAAPMITQGMEGLTEVQYQKMFYNRICGILKCAAYWGYQALVLGAFGCGAFGNDANLVSDLFYKALKEFNYDGMMAKDFFRRIDFAVLDRSSGQYNFNEFNRNFNHFYRDEDNAETEKAEKRKKDREINLDPIRGCLFGGAAGDALGYAVEFMEDDAIFQRYGTDGITEYDFDQRTGKALISDDTQMTLFTANGLLVGDTRGCMRGIQGWPRGYVAKSYQDWLFTQTHDVSEGKSVDRKEHFNSWLCDVPEMYHRRAPGNTCLSALEEAKHSAYIDDYIANPKNDSKGCGGVMRVAPLALNYQMDMETLDMEAAQIAAITHGHSLGYMPAAVLCHIINRIVYPVKQKMRLKEIVLEAKETAEKIFAGDKHLKELTHLIDRAIELSENDMDDLENIRLLGQGWVAEETLAIAIYCSLKYANDFSNGIIAAVNHSGDSDSTGAVTGNILGALVGYKSIEEKWKQNLECADVILEMADDICHGCQMSEYSSYYDADWARKYMNMRRREQVPQYVFFFHEYEKNGYLSNWFESEFIVDGFCYQHVEQYLMARKARLFNDAKSYTAILRAQTPKECKALGRKVTPFDNAIWETNRYEILKDAVRAKFSQSEDLKAKLLATGKSIIAEASPYDDIYGIRLTADEAASMQPTEWPGRNLLGKALMEIRAELGGGFH